MIRPQAFSLLNLISFAFFTIPLSRAEITIYTTLPGATTTTTALVGNWTGVASQDPTLLNPPAPPTGQSSSFLVQLYDGGMVGMGNPVVSTSIQQCYDR